MYLTGFEHCLLFNSPKLEHPWKLSVIGKSFSTFHFKSRCATEDPWNCCQNSCLHRSQLTEQNLAGILDGKTGGPGSPDSCFPSLSSSGLQKTSHVYLIHQSIPTVKETVMRGALCTQEYDWHHYSPDAVFLSPGGREEEGTAQDNLS